MGMTYIRAALYLGSGVLSYQRRFPVVYFIRWAMRRPRTANKQLEVCAFFVCLCVNTAANRLIVSNMFLASENTRILRYKNEE